jgi:hypothetical protein
MIDSEKLKERLRIVSKPQHFGTYAEPERVNFAAQSCLPAWFFGWERGRAIAAEIQTLRIACQPQERRDKRKQVLYTASRLCALSIC